METRMVGATVRRREDPALITGEAQYTDDFQVEGAVHAAVLRSQHGHARIEDVDTSAAEARDDVLAVYTARDVEASGQDNAVSIGASPPGGRTTTFPLLAGEMVRYTGEAIAVVLAESRYTARDAVGDVEVRYERLDAVTTAEEALADGAPTVHDSFDDNLGFDWAFGDEEAVAEAFEDADHVTTVELSNQRVIPNAMEPRTILAEYDADDRTLTVTRSTQAPHRNKAVLANVLRMPIHRIRVIAPAVGGGFGSKGGSPYPEDALVAWCALETGRPVKWVAARGESHVSDHHGRDIRTRSELALDADGTIRGLRVEGTCNLGAYVAWGQTPANNFRRLITGQYEIPAVSAHFVGAFTNTCPVAPYRGAGRPEAVFNIERAVSVAAAELGLDPAELRRRNQIPSDAFPYTTALGSEYDSGDYGRALELALDHLSYDDLRERQAELREEGRYLGIGISCLIENSGSAPGRLTESGRVRMDASGRVDAYCGTADHGQGHGTAFAQMLADELGVDSDDVVVHEGDTDDLLTGTGTFGSRSMAVGGSALAEAARKVREQAKQVAAHHLEAAESDVTFEDGEFHVKGAPDRAVHISEVAALAHSPEKPADLDADLDSMVEYDPENFAYPFGTHAVALEVDPDSGEIRFEKYVAVDDCGVQINPMLVHGQVQGGVAQGVGQALYEGAVYDDNGTLVTGTFQDYAMPRAEHVPRMVNDSTETPCPHNPIGVKGIGESGATAAPPAVVNAVCDALAPLGVDPDDLQMPLTPETVWRAVRNAE